MTKDGSHTLYLPDLDETYHSTHGALQEAEYIFIAKGLVYLAENKNAIRILEIGFGTGLNAILTLSKAVELTTKVEYTTLEPYPLEHSLIEKLNYLSFLDKLGVENFDTLHTCDWEKNHIFNPFFNFKKQQTRLQDLNLENESFDLIYYDAFAPSRQADIWELENIQKCYDSLRQKGVLISYCASGQFKRNLKEVGFELEALAGPPGKREITRAIK